MDMKCHLSLLSLTNDPCCSCNKALESVSHFLCHCNYFATLKIIKLGKQSLHATDIDSVTVRDVVKSIRKCQRIL